MKAIALALRELAARTTASPKAWSQIPPRLRQLVLQLLIVLAVGLVIQFNWGRESTSTGPATLASPPERPPATTSNRASPSTNSPGSGPLGQRPIPSAGDEHRRRSLLAVARTNIMSLHHQAHQLHEPLDRLHAELTSWRVTYFPLLTNDAGRRLAASTHAEAALRVLKRLRPTAEDASAWLAQLDQLQEPLDLAIQDKQTEPSVDPSLATAIAQLANQVQSALAQLEADRLSLDRLLIQVQETAPGEQTLQELDHARDAAQATDRSLESKPAPPVPTPITPAPTRPPPTAQPPTAPRPSSAPVIRPPNPRPAILRSKSEPTASDSIQSQSPSWRLLPERIAAEWTRPSQLAALVDACKHQHLVAPASGKGTCRRSVIVGRRVSANESHGRAR